MKRLNSLRHRYFAFYSVLAIIPVIIFVLLYRFGTLGRFKSDISRTYSEDGYRFLSFVDYRNQEINKYSSMFSNYIYGSLEDLKDEGLEGASDNMLSDMLMGYEERFGGGLSAYYYEKGSSVIHSSRGPIHFREFEESDLAGVDLLKIPAFTLANMSRFPLIRNSWPNTFFFCPVPEYAFIQRSIMIFMVDDRMLNENAAEYFTLSHPDWYITGSDGGLIYSSGPEAVELCDSRRGNSDWVGIDVKSEVTGMTLHCSSLSSEIYREYHSKYISFLLMTLFVTCAMLILAWLLSGVSYIPIKNLMNIIGHRDHTLHKDEMKILNDNLSDIVDENSRLAGSLEERNALLEKIVLRRLMLGEMDGKSSDRNDISELMSSLFAHKYFSMMVLGFLDMGDASESLGLVSSCLSSYDSPAMSLFVPDIDNEGHLSVIVNSDSDDAEENATALRNIIDDSFHLSYGVAVSAVHDSVYNLNIAYLEAGTTFESVRNSETKYYDSSSGSSCSYVIPQSMYNLMKHAMQSGNLNGACCILDNMFAFVDSSRAIPLLRQGMFYDVFNIVIRCAENMGYTDLPFRYVLTDMKDEGKLREELVSCIAYVIRQYRIMQDSRHSEEMNRIIMFIDSNYRDNQISLSDISEKFSFSVSTLSRAFKNEVGCGFVDYVANLRFSWIKKELMNTDHLIRDIITESGYTNISGTMKKFKEREGMTMKEYRDLNKVRL